MKHLKKHPINDKAQRLSKIKKEDHTKKKKEKKIDGEKYLAETPKKRGSTSKPTNKKLDGEKFLSERLLLEGDSSDYVVINSNLTPVLEDSGQMKLFTGKEASDFTQDNSGKYIVLSISNNMLKSHLW